MACRCLSLEPLLLLLRCDEDVWPSTHTRSIIWSWSTGFIYLVGCRSSEGPPTPSPYNSSLHGGWSRTSQDSVEIHLHEGFFPANGRQSDPTSRWKPTRRKGEPRPVASISGLLSSFLATMQPRVGCGCGCITLSGSVPMAFSKFNVLSTLLADSKQHSIIP
ncbi:hypothetical protein BO71DRAFT_216579 [Aspergillus ellipticus CBS 707.79]|uniref:Uncharacterized protein n=1 Tax=Aspergillus ellipticus CBS 707.79 TaxID=1448320 RepID=A0A319DC12_9EURO|nr:hypothetical protein BO71DRAFT_216579 [Aspergillus ellipticus CBS 707.79]